MAAASMSEPAVALPQSGLVGLLWRMRFIGLGLIVAGFSAGAYVYLTTPPARPDSSYLRQALKELDAGRVQAARSTITRLQDEGYIDPDFPGGVEFIRGWAAFTDALARDEVTREPAYLAAASFLQAADRLSVPEERRPQWAYALGLSLFRAGAVDAAMPYLKEAVETYPPGRVESSMALIDAWLDSHEPELVERAEALSGGLVTDPSLPEDRRDFAWLQRAQVLVRLGKKTEAEQALQNVSKTFEADQGKVVLRALVTMAEDEAKALEMLRPVAEHDGFERLFAGQASYLQGVCAERLAQKARTNDPGEPTAGLSKESLGWLENAVTYYERTAERFERSQEALAASLGAADALRELGRAEESLEAYGRVLRTLRTPQTFRNRWLSLRRVQERVRTAWQTWIDQERFADAAALAELMPPAIPRTEADDLFARAHQSWVDQFENQVANFSYADRQASRAGLIVRWRQCGDAWARSADSRLEGHAEALARSAEQYTKGQEFDKAVRQWSKIIDSQPPHLITTALLRRGQVYLDLDRSEDALADFQRLIADYPTDQNVFQAQYRLGLCQLERNQPEEAEAIWRKLLSNGALTPQSEEWRMSLYQLARLMFLRADEELRATLPVRTELAVRETREKAYTRLDEVIQRLDEYLDRYPDSPEAPAARAVLGRALRRSSERFEEKRQSAETENARAEFQQQRQGRLKRAVEQFEPLQQALSERQRRNELDDVERAILRDACFELGHCLFGLEQYEAAIDAYQVCVGRYQQDPETLVALVQMANCYRRMRETSRVVSTLAQARLMLKQLPDEAFVENPGTLSRSEWTRWLDWAIKLNE